MNDVPHDDWFEFARRQVAEPGGAISQPVREAWTALLQQCRDAKAAKPTSRWIQTAGRLLAIITPKTFEQNFCDWVSQMDRRITKGGGVDVGFRLQDSEKVSDENAHFLRGLLWCAMSVLQNASQQKQKSVPAEEGSVATMPLGPVDAVELCRCIGHLAVIGFKKLRAIGPRSLKLGNGAVYVLGEIGSLDSLTQLAILKGRTKTASARNAIEKAIHVIAQRMGISPVELEEIAVPGYGLDLQGRRRSVFDGYTAELRIVGKRVEIEWFRPDGKPQKSVPASVRRDFAVELKEIKGEAKEIDQMLPALASRIEQSYVGRRVWTYANWRRRFLDHALVGTIARRLVWTIARGDRTVNVLANPRRETTCETALPLHSRGLLVNQQGEPLDDVFVEELDRGDEFRVRLWHPLESTTEEILAWRELLDREQISQPFKQTHREIYPLTEAERRTASYSNRFAAHVLRQHQFHALCGARGWSNKLRLMVDDVYPPPHLILPEWGLRAEFWIESIGDNYERDVTESGTYLLVATDQVRFYSLQAAANLTHATGGGYTMFAHDTEENHPLLLDQIPPILFSEVMRDVDLFVGVASVGNDPNWHDGGPEGRFLDYWQTYSFGDLGVSAQSRKEVLEKLIPRLKIANRCSFNDRFLVVRGEIRTYKIHLGSGNILMEPNDQYLCIVPNQTVESKSEPDLFLPFEGDRLLSIILSKAFLLASDKQITDRTILSQILA